MLLFYMAVTSRKIVDETHLIPAARGNGKLRREIWVDGRGKVVRYNLAYINHAISQRDHGRVVGYDNGHDGHHRHYMGKVTSVVFSGFAAIEQRFQRDWLALSKGKKK